MSLATQKDRPMRSTAPDLTLKVTATDRPSMDDQLDEAVATLRTRALSERREGILVTRHGHDSFTVALSGTVPFGVTREYQDW
jgi:hypothetical protein